jgi:hypothetical protein
MSCVEMGWDVRGKRDLFVSCRGEEGEIGEERVNN